MKVGSQVVSFSPSKCKSSEGAGQASGQGPEQSTG